MLSGCIKSRARTAGWNFVKNPKRSIITGPTKTGSGASTTGGKKGGKDGKGDSSSSPFDSSFSFQLFLLVGAMGAGYTLGKTSVLTSPPATLFPNGSTTPYETLKEFEKEDKERQDKQYDMFKRCALRILESKGIEVDMKYGENESLYEEKYCSKDIAVIMNTADGMGDVFFGKDPKEWESKSFVWYPETTEDVSKILKNCDEFKIPVNSRSSGIPTDGLSFVIDYKNFQVAEPGAADDKIELTFNMDAEQINERLSLSSVAQLNGKLNALDLFFMEGGVKLSSSNNKQINNRFDINDIDAIECVLPDGTVLNVNNDVGDKDSYKLFNLLCHYQDDLCLITKVYVNKKIGHGNGSENEARVTSPNYSLVVVGSNSVASLNDTIKELNQRVDSKRISIVDNNGCVQIGERYGDYKTFAVAKVNADELARLNKKFRQKDVPHGSAHDQTVMIENISISNILSSGDGLVYLSDKVSSGDRAVLVKESISSTDSPALKAYYVADPREECVSIDATDDVARSLSRRIKLSLDSSRILNRNGSECVAIHAST